MDSFDRRRFGALLAGFKLASAPSGFADGGPDRGGGLDPEVLQLSCNGWVPNHERLPVLLYRSAIAAGGEDPCLLFEELFRRNGWPPQWRNGVYDYHHYHSTAHEVLGFVRGKVRLMLGGERGHETTVHAGDVAVLPAGTGHCKLEADPGFLVVGAYPPDQLWDICRSAPSPEALRRMDALPFPSSDPVSGSSGPLTRLWLPPRSRPR